MSSQSSKTLENFARFSDEDEMLETSNSQEEKPKSCFSSLETLTEKHQTLTSPGVTFRVVLAAVVAFLTNSFPSGFNIGGVNTPEEVFKQFFERLLFGVVETTTKASLAEDKLSDNASKVELFWSVAVSLLLVGAFIGCIFTGYLANTIGRRGLLLLNSVVGLFGAVLCCLAAYLPSGPYVFMSGRFFSGVATGVGSSLVPMYLAEITPKSMQSTFGTFHVLGMTIGATVAMVLGLESILGTSSHWQFMFAINGLLIGLGLLGIAFCPESPTFLFVMQKNEAKAIESLEAIRGQPQFELVNEIQAMQAELKAHESSNLNVFQLLQQSQPFRSSLLIVCVLHAGQQFAGINAVFYYSTKTFKSVGLSALVAQYSSIGCILVNTISSLLAIPLLRSFSQRGILLVSSAVTATSMLLLTLCMTFKEAAPWLNYATILLILTFVFFFAIGLGPIPYMIGSDLFDQSTMAIGMSIGCFVNWFCNFLIAICFPMLVLTISQYVFLLFLFANFLLFIFVYCKVPHRAVTAN